MSEPKMLCPLSYLRTKDNLKLLRPFDKELESVGIVHLLRSLPQIVVCGNRSSGKSSILEAISGQRFPVKNDFCTRFPIELTLYKGAKKPTRVWIRADATRCEADVQRLGCYYRTIPGEPNIEEIIREAECFLGLSKSDEIVRDTLCINLYGPGYPHLTLVDLPGLFEAKGGVENNTVNAKMIRALIRWYVGKPGSVILAAISGLNKHNDLPIRELSKLVGPKRLWTLFVLTKPDTIQMSSVREEKYMRCISDRRAGFCLRWHVLRNRTPSEHCLNMEQRDENERKFFSHSRWGSLNRSYLGAEALRLRVNDMLKSQVELELQDHSHMFELDLPKCRETLSRLGPCHTSIEELRSYLLRIGTRVGDLINNAFLGDYTCPFFMDGEASENDKRFLRAVICRIGGNFIERMKKEGHALEIVSDDAVLTDRKIHRNIFIDNVQQIIKEHRGLEQPGTFNSRVLQALFEAQAAPWDAIINKFEREVIEATQNSVEQAVCYVADRHTASHIMKHVHKCIDELEKSLHCKIMDVRSRIVKGHQIMYNQHYIHAMQRARSAAHEQSLRQNLKPYLFEKDEKIHIEGNFEHVINTICKTIEEPDMDRYASIQAIYAMESYYNIALRHVTMGIVHLVIEQTFIQQLVSLFHCNIVKSLGQEAIRSIALEHEHAAISRRFLNDRIERTEKQIGEIREYKDYCDFTRKLPSVICTNPGMLHNIASEQTELKPEDRPAEQTATEPEETPESPVLPPVTPSRSPSLSSWISLHSLVDSEALSTNTGQRPSSPASGAATTYAHSESRSDTSGAIIEKPEGSSATVSRRSSISQQSRDSSEYVFPDTTLLPDPALVSLFDSSQINDE